MATAGAEPGGFTRRPPRHRRLGDEQQQQRQREPRGSERKYNLKSMFSVKDEDLQVIVQKALANPAAECVRIVSHRVESFSKNRHGIMGNHYALAVEVELGTTTTTLQFFVKTPPESTALRDSLVDEWVSLEEVHFFAEVYPVLTKNYKGPRWCAECYLAKPELLVFQDLRSQGFSVRGSGIFDEASLKSALSTLARFHASSIIAEAAMGGQPLDRVYRQAFREKIFTDVGKGGRANELAFRTMRRLADKFDLLLDAGRLLPAILARLCQLVKPVPGGCNVICHGDLWRSNIMFDNDDSKTHPNCIIVDYQMLRYASPSVDLAVLLYVHASPEFRASSEPRMLRHYYDVFRETLESCELQSRIPAYQDFLRDYEERKLVGMACAAMRWPKYVFERVMNEPADLRKWYFESRIDVYERAIERDPNYARITRDCLLELLEEGERVLNL